MDFYLSNGYVCRQIITAYRRKPTAYGKTVYIGKKVVKMAFVTTKQHKLHNAGADMKIRVEIDEQAQTDEVIIRCKSLTDEVAQIQKAVSDLIAEKKRIVFYKGDAAYYFPLDEILFFETDADGICAHTKDDIYKIHYRLYELEELLPGYFLRISKSAILNIRKIYAIDRNLSSASIVSFQNTYKKVYVSRRYYKPLKDRLEERG